MAKLAKTVPPTPPEAAGAQPLPRLKERRGATKAPLDFSHLVTEDGAPVDNWFSELQMQLLDIALDASWPCPERPFVVGLNIGLFSDTEPVMVPDVLLAVDVEATPGPLTDKTKAGRSYFMSLYGKAPDVVVEVVSNDEGGEMEKLPRYARLGVRYTVLFDPNHCLSAHTLRVFSLRTDGSARESRSRTRFWMPRLGLGLTLWQGRYKYMATTWLRWCDRAGRILPTEAERREANAARERTLSAAQRTRAERAEAEAERLRRANEAIAEQAARYAQKLRDAGLELE